VTPPKPTHRFPGLAGNIDPVVDEFTATNARINGEGTRNEHRACRRPPARAIAPLGPDTSARAAGVMRIPASRHTSRPWRIHGIAPDFTVLDVWALPTPGGPDDFLRLVSLFASTDPSQGSGRASSLVWSVRERLGQVLGLDGPDSGIGERTPSLRDRLPADLQGSTGPDIPNLPFIPVYLTGDEWVAELANKTVHGVMHLSWVPDESGGYRGQMAVLVKPNGVFGSAYMAGIRPFRHVVVYPALMRRFERGWKASAGGPAPTQ
jgi:hypothetical protein